MIDIAGAYLFYLCANHPFLDGNKRTALGACLVFLKINGATASPDSKEWETLTLEVAAGSLSRKEVTERLRTLVSTSQ
ncbi:MAG: type II toxin-antitoxin system death-on-curing family toxin [Verrucomicrobiota bacterium]